MTTTTVKEDTTWDFRGCDTKEFTHCFHMYPAMMIPQIARRLIEAHGHERGILLDPYCGTGTSLVEATLFGMHGVGCDINPLARLIATTKTTTILPEILDNSITKFEAATRRKTRTKIDIPEVHGIEYWFSDKITEQLGKIRSNIMKIDNITIQNFFWVAFSETVRECSYTRNGEFKLFRMPKEKLDDYNPDPYSIIISKLNRNLSGMLSYINNCKDVEVIVSEANTSNFDQPPSDELIDIIVTSPPYGDSSTTVAYGQYSRLSSDWLGLPDSKKVDKISMGGTKKEGGIPFSPVTSAIEQIESQDNKRSREVEAFYLDLGNSINCLAEMMAEESTVCYVVGNRRVKGVVLPTNKFIVDQWEKHGYRHEATFTRNIPNKRMPSINSPTNVAGKTAHTMNKEYIVVCSRV